MCPAGRADYQTKEQDLPRASRLQTGKPSHRPFLFTGKRSTLFHILLYDLFCQVPECIQSLPVIHKNKVNTLHIKTRLFVDKDISEPGKPHLGERRDGVANKENNSICLLFSGYDEILAVAD